MGSAGVGLAGLVSGCATRAPQAPISTAPVAVDGWTRLDQRPALDVEVSPLIDDIQKLAFRYFWEVTDEKTGMSPDRWPTPSFVSIAAMGFALTAYPIGVTHGWITRAEARERTLTTLQFLAAAPMGNQRSGVSGYRDFFYHFLGSTKGYRFSLAELSTIDTGSRSS